MTISHVLDHLSSEGLLYLTGKLTESENSQLIKKSDLEFQVFSFNGMSYKNPLDIFADIYTSIADAKTSEKVNATNFPTFFEKLKTSVCKSKKIK
jgi:hypothetical protein